MIALEHAGFESWSPSPTAVAEAAVYLLMSRSTQIFIFVAKVVPFLCADCRFAFPRARI